MSNTGPPANTPPFTDQMRVELAPSQVTYILPTAHGTRMIHIFLNTPSPRICAYARTGRGEEPIMVELEELQMMVQDAKRRLGLP